MPRLPGSKNKVQKLNYRNIPYKDWPEWAKEIQRARARKCNAKRYATHPELQYEASARWFEKNPDEIRARARERYHKNPEKQLVLNRRRYHERRDEYLAARRAQYQVKKEYWRLLARIHRAEIHPVVKRLGPAMKEDIRLGRAEFYSDTRIIKYKPLKP